METRGTIWLKSDIDEIMKGDPRLRKERIAQHDFDLDHRERQEDVVRALNYLKAKAADRTQQEVEDIEMIFKWMKWTFATFLAATAAAVIGYAITLKF